MARINPTGHTALYFDHICAESLTQLRACRTGEQGVVISRYDDIANLDWVAMPLLPYLYAVDYSTQIPNFMDRVTLSKLRDDYRRAHLQSIVPDLPDGSAPEGNWYELAGSAYDRTIFAFQLKTTPEQDAAMIALLNDRRNVERYNGAFRNCADFVRVTLNRIYPHAIRRNFIADFGLTTPKSVARALHQYGKHHPEADLTVFQIPQVPGWLPRSRRPVGVTEGLIKTYGVPMIVLSPLATGIVYAAYLGQGRLTLPTDAPVLDLRETDPDLAAAYATVNAVPLAQRAEVATLVRSDEKLAAHGAVVLGSDASDMQTVSGEAGTATTAAGDVTTGGLH